MSVVVDARGLPCPQPVIRTRDAMRESDDIITLVSGEDQVGNVRRLAEKAGWRVESEAHSDGYAIHMVKAKATPQPQVAAQPSAGAVPVGRVIVLSSERMGRGDEELGTILMRSLLYTLGEVEPAPKTLILYNSGVKLAVEGSPVIEELAALQARGVEILVCGTCLGHFDLKDSLQVGTISNMYVIAEALLAAGSAITV